MYHCDAALELVFFISYGYMLQSCNIQMNVHRYIAEIRPIRRKTLSLNQSINKSDECISFVLFLEIRDQTSVEMSNATPAAVGGTLSACFILIIVVAALVIR